MPHNFLQQRKLLLSRLAELDGRLHAIEAELDVAHSKDWADAAVEREGEEVLEKMGKTGQDEVQRILAALRRIRGDEYGFCAQCGSEIATERLNILPDTPFCRTCAATHGA